MSVAKEADVGPAVTQSKTEPDSEEGKEYLNTQPTTDEPAPSRTKDQEKSSMDELEETAAKETTGEVPKPKRIDSFSDARKESQANDGSKNNDNKVSNDDDGDNSSTTTTPAPPTLSRKSTEQDKKAEKSLEKVEPLTTPVMSRKSTETSQPQQHQQQKNAQEEQARTQQKQSQVQDQQRQTQQSQQSQQSQPNSKSKSSSSPSSSSSSMIYNVHAPEHSFALPAKSNESAISLLSRIAKKSGLSVDAQLALQAARNSAAGVKYEYQGGRYDLEDEDDLEVLRKRFPEGETESVTLHIVLPQGGGGGGHSSGNGSSYQQQQQQKTATSNNNNNQNSSSGSSSQSLDRPVAPAAHSVRSTATASQRITGGRKTVHGPTGSIIDLDVSTRGESQAQESLGDKHKRLWKDFHDNNGVRTVVGKVGEVDGVRMLLKPGYSGVYVSRAFASEHGFIPKTVSGWTAWRNLAFAERGI